MAHVIAVMNTKGGVGKSTLVMALAETLAAHHGKRVLLIDSDGQMSLSLMVMPVAELQKRRLEGATLVELLRRTALAGEKADWRDFVVGDTTDVDETTDVWLLPSDMHLTLLEREFSAMQREVDLRKAVRALLVGAANYFDIIMIDCPPGLSVVTETWLREADFHLTPVKPDFLAVSGLETLRNFKKLNPELGFAENIGVVVNLMEPGSDMDALVHKALLQQVDLRCFPEALPRLNHMQHAALFTAEKRSYLAKYPGVAGQKLRALASELLRRIDTHTAIKNAESAAASQPPAAAKPVQPAAAPTSAAQARPTQPAQAAPAPANSPPMQQPAAAQRPAPAAPPSPPRQPAAAQQRPPAAAQPARPPEREREPARDNAGDGGDAGKKPPEGTVVRLIR